MRNLDTLKLDIRLAEKACLEVNNTGAGEASNLFFVQIDSMHAVASDGVIFQIFDGSIEDLERMQEDDDQFHIILAYKSEKGTVYSYAEDTDDFAETSKEMNIYDICFSYAELHQ